MRHSEWWLPNILLVAIGIAACLAAPAIPDWIRFIVQIALASALVSLGVVLLLRAGLLSFGQGLYYLLGGYSVAVASRYLGMTDAIAGVALGVSIGAIFAALLGGFIARYRGIFFAMLTLALAMIVYGLVLKFRVLGGTDGINVRPATWLGYAPRGADLQMAGFRFVIATMVLCLLLVRIFLLSRLGRFVDAVRENEIRVEYLGRSVRSVVLVVYIIAGALGGAGGALAAMTARHVEPTFAYWTTSGEFVFVAVLGGVGNVFAPVIASLFLETVRSWASSLLPEYWQMLLGVMMLAVVLLRPGGLVPADGLHFLRKRLAAYRSAPREAGS